MELIIGSHVSFLSNSGLLGSVEESLIYGSNTFMIYTGPNQSSFRSEINMEFTKNAWELMKKNNIDINNVMVHAPFIVNLANDSDARKYNFYIHFMKEEIGRCKALGIKNLIFHPGSRTNIEAAHALDNIVFGINKIMEGITDFNLIIEFMSGKGTEVGSTIEDIEYIMNNINCKENVGVCLDTCHMNDSGIDLNMFDEFLSVFDKKIGIDKIKCIHINDSLNELGMHKDRHANIGYGTIGFNTLINVIYNESLKEVPKILETPYVKDIPPYKYEIESIRNKSFIDFKSNL